MMAQVAVRILQTLHAVQTIDNRVETTAHMVDVFMVLLFSYNNLSPCIAAQAGPEQRSFMLTA